jgi:hypothetical protein
VPELVLAPKLMPKLEDRPVWLLAMEAALALGTAYFVPVSNAAPAPTAAGALKPVARTSLAALLEETVSPDFVARAAPVFPMTPVAFSTAAPKARPIV